MFVKVIESKNSPNLSPESIRNELTHVQATILKDIATSKRYCVPSNLNENIKNIYKIMDLRISDVPFEIM